jgi:hypothetical protein
MAHHLGHVMMGDERSYSVGDEVLIVGVWVV